MEYLLAAILLSAAGIVFVVVRNRRPTGMSHSIGEFEKGLRAIAPEEAAQTRRTARPDAGPTGVRGPG